ncbi:AlpA family transcriptional regulator [Leifsonia sp. TF02-11]|uniref:helix-turn-helix transcriptional regulator n=1 Tax=Leifsonia sp. TF02-11 TaxID=2815212 RepID=UPI001AA0C26F|nr:hypothetical protein [Leifsonia sp. TF02-11]MBO1739810.1 hypothetical protein [Leifsonia sp. TF02-11]
MTGEFIRPADVAELTGLTVAALAQLRYRGKGPRYYKPTPHSVIYRRAEVIAWLETTVQTSTAVPA